MSRPTHPAKPMMFEAANDQRSTASLPPGGGGGTFDGMDPWQRTVESRLGELRTDTRSLVSDLSGARIDLSALKATVAQLPTKGFIALIVIGGMGLFGGFTVFAGQIKALFGLH